MTFNRIVAIALVALCLVAAIIGGSRSTQDSGSALSTTPERLGANRIEVIRLEGVIGGGGGGFGPDFSAASVERQLRSVVKDKSVKGVLLEINSPGGAVGTSQEVYRAVEAVKSAKKPVIVTMGDVAASGGYYIASAADKIYANPGTLTGSIGVIVQVLGYTELLNKIGVQPLTVKTGIFKDILSPFRPPTTADRELVQALVDDTLTQFVKDVAKGRMVSKDPKGSGSVLSAETKDLRSKLTEARVKELADGRIFTGRQALAEGLIDALGGTTEAVADLRKLLDDEEENLQIGGEGSPFERVLRQLTQNRSAGFSLETALQWLLNSGLSSGLGGGNAPSPLQSSVLWLTPDLITR